MLKHKIVAENLTVQFQDYRALRDVSLAIVECEILAIICREGRRRIRNY